MAWRPTSGAQRRSARSTGSAWRSRRGTSRGGGPPAAPGPGRRSRAPATPPPDPAPRPWVGAPPTPPPLPRAAGRPAPGRESRRRPVVAAHQPPHVDARDSGQPVREPGPVTYALGEDDREHVSAGEPLELVVEDAAIQACQAPCRRGLRETRVADEGL